MKFSIVTASFNSEKTIKDTIDSLIEQTWEDFEVLIIDGKSTDSTCKIVQSYQDSRIRLISEKDNGIYFAMNKGYEDSRGDIIGFLNSDDFFSHSGVSYTGLMRSLYRIIVSGRIQGGGSTITMQVAGNYLTSRDVSLYRKVKDIFLAYRFEKIYSKEEIFEFYVNRIFFGNRAYGIAAASEVYYGKPLSDLNLAQWAMIAALPKAPSSINPLANPKRAIIRRNWILNRMLDLS